MITVEQKIGQCFVLYYVAQLEAEVKEARNHEIKIVLI